MYKIANSPGTPVVTLRMRLTESILFWCEVSGVLTMLLRRYIYTGVTKRSSPILEYVVLCPFYGISFVRNKIFKPFGLWTDLVWKVVNYFQIFQLFSIVDTWIPKKVHIFLLYLVYTPVIFISLFCTRNFNTVL